jgi:bifunctional glutamyl/prolyl-tRNA synthetase
LYGSNILQKTEVDHWLTFCLGPLSCGAELQAGLVYLDSVLVPATFLVGNAVRQNLKSVNIYHVFVLISNVF